MTPSTFRQRVMAILWPAFLMAGVLEMLVFAMVDPTQLHWFGSAPVELPPAGVYTMAFFVFWAAISTSGALTQLLELSPGELNRQPPAKDSADPSADQLNNLRR